MSIGEKKQIIDMAGTFFINITAMIASIDFSEQVAINSNSTNKVINKV